MTEAIVIRTLPLREYDQLAVLYCRDRGRMAAIAKGALRSTSRQGLALDDGNLIRCHLMPGRTGTPVITGAQAQRSWATAKASPVAWATAAFFLEALDVVVYDDQPDEGLWSALIDSFEVLDANGDPLTVLRQGQVRMLEVLGYGRRPIPERIGAVRTELDDEFEHIAQRRLDSIPFLYQVAASRR